ncbi:hypothetical protein EJ08DRAFT_574196, partial [Tothia fuscella]
MFAGAKFWVAQRIPMRQFRLAQITEHGGLVVPLEKSADVLVWDHIKPDAPAGAISWTYIDQSVKNGALEDMNDHICGPPPGTVRAVGSDTSIRAGGHMRQPYTAADDRLCYKWGREGETKGAGVKGNELWKRLEMVNNRHTWQSWRSRWVKSLSHTEGPTGWEDVEIQAPAVKEEDSNVLRSTPGNARHRSPERRSPGEKRKIGAIKKIIGSAGNIADIALQHATTTAITMQTQAIVAAETQVHDFDIPEPEEGFAEDSEEEDDDEIDPQEQHDQDLLDQQLQLEADAGLEEYIAKGYSEQDVITACEATSGNRDLIELVLKSLRNGRGVPKDVRGVWSEEDDAHLQGSDARMIKRVEGKHG